MADVDGKGWAMFRHVAGSSRCRPSIVSVTASMAWRIDEVKVKPSGGNNWPSAIRVDLPQLLSNTRLLVAHDSNPDTPPIFSTSGADRLAAAGIRVAHKQELKCELVKLRCP